MSIQRFPARTSLTARLRRAMVRLVIAVAVMAGLTVVCALPASAELRSEGMGPTADVSPDPAPVAGRDRSGALAILTQAASHVVRMSLAGPAEGMSAAARPVPTVAQLWAGMAVGMADVLRAPAISAPPEGAAPLQTMVGAAIADMARSVHDAPAANERRASTPVTP